MRVEARVSTERAESAETAALGCAFFLRSSFMNMIPRVQTEILHRTPTAVWPLPELSSVSNGGMPCSEEVLSLIKCLHTRPLSVYSCHGHYELQTCLANHDLH